MTLIPLKYNVRSLMVRRATTLTTAGAVALVVLVFAALSSLVEGLRASIVRTGSVQNVLLLSPGAISVAASALRRGVTQQVRSLSDVATAPDGTPLVSEELLLSEDVFYPKLGQWMPTPLRGVHPVAFDVHPGITFAEGSPPRGGGQVILGRKIAAQLAGVKVGGPFRLGRRVWTLAGVFTAEGAGFESEIWTDLADLIAASRIDRLSAVVLRVRAGESAAALGQRLSQDARLAVSARPESEYYADQAQDARGLSLLTLILSTILVVAAAFAAMNTLYAAVAARVTEVGCLRALGFSRRSVLLSFVAEGTLLALAGGLCGCLLALAVDGVQLRVLAAGRFLDFRLFLTPRIALEAIGLSLVIGAAAAALPAWQASRLEIVEAIRQR